MNKKDIPNKSYFQEIGDLFRLPGEVKKITLLKNGSTADTYRIDYDTKKKYLFQKVKVQRDEFVATMDNVEQITSYLNKEGHNILHLHHTNSEENYIEYHEEFWRVKRYFDSCWFNGILFIFQEFGCHHSTGMGIKFSGPVGC